MNATPNPNKHAIQAVRTTAGIASGVGDYGLANRLWAFEATLRSRDQPAVDVLTQLQHEYAILVRFGGGTKQEVAYRRGLRRAIELIGGPSAVPDSADIEQTLPGQAQELLASTGSLADNVRASYFTAGERSPVEPQTGDNETHE